MAQRFKIGDRVSWNSEAGRVRGKIVHVHTKDLYACGDIALMPENQGFLACCGAIERMPSNVCQIFYDCRGCGARLKAKPGDCCVFCSYGSVPCPPAQAKQANVQR